MGIHRRKEDFLRKKKKSFTILFELHKGISKITITVEKDTSRISLVKLVATIISVISIKRGNTFEVATFGGSQLLAYTNSSEILSLLSKGCYFWGGGGGVVTLGTLRYLLLIFWHLHQLP